jgi:lipopolysaccharide biosynthesis glycosyltransferase
MKLVGTGASPPGGAIMSADKSRQNPAAAERSHDARISIYQSIFNDAKTVANGIIKPIQVGSALTADHYGILRDDTGDNISHLNRMYGELTGHYWAWKNDATSAYIGLFHYRRLFIFKPGFERQVNREGDRVVVPRLDEASVAAFGWDEADIAALVQGCDIVLPMRFFVRTDGKRPRNCGEHFVRNHGEANYRAMLRLIELHSPEHVAYAERFFASDRMYLANMFVMRRDLFEAYSGWLFRLLDAVRQTLDCMRFDKYQVRMPAFMAERLFNIYLMRLRDIEPELKIKEIPYVFIENTVPSPKPLAPVGGRRPIVSIVTGFDRNYVPCFAACLASIAEAADPEIFYDIIVLADAVPNSARALLAAQIRPWPHIGLRYIDMPAEFERAEAIHGGHFTKATFFRLKLAELLPSHDKIIYLDPDAIVLEDIGKLYDVDVSDVYAGAVPDFTMQLQIATGFHISAAFGRKTRKEYWDEHLQLSPAAQLSYFNAGVMIFNLAKIRAGKLVERFEELFWSQRFDLLDQDILNKVFDGRIVALDQRWNIIAQPIKAMESLPFKLYEECLAARDNPAVLHFAGWWLKPWKTREADFAEYFWLFARKTAFYEAAHEAFIRNCLLAERDDTAVASRWLDALSRRWRKLFQRGAN